MAGLGLIGFRYLAAENEGATSASAFDCMCERPAVGAGLGTQPSPTLPL